jgi:hypothetical protein
LNNYQPSHNCPVRFQVLGQGTVAQINVTSHDLDIEVLLYDVTNVTHGGDRARIAGLRDASATINADFDADYPPYLFPPNIIEGTSGIFLFYYSALALGRPIQVPMIIGKIHYSMKIAEQTKWSFDVKLNKLAGLLVYPGL